jgi:iron complex outermembrane receptor protein
MNRNLLTALRVSAAALAIAAAASPLRAQDAPAPPPQQLHDQAQQPGPGSETPSGPEAAANQNGNDIVVTARRRAENLIDVPIAVTAYTGAALEASGARDILDIGDTTPNVTLEASRGTNSTLTAFIRGVGQQDPVAGFEAGVGIYLDDVYLNRPQAAVLDIYDVERIEVLRGPQGTLYGRNTIGGAIKYVTRRLSDDPSLSIRGTLGTYDQADLVVTASTPVGSDAFKIGGSFARLSRGGFGTDLTTRQDNYNKDIWAGRGTIELQPNKDVLFRLTADYTADDSNARGGHRLIPGLASGTPILANVFDSQSGLNDPRQKVWAWGVALHGDINLTPDLVFRTITAYRKDHSASPIDFDALPAVDVDVPALYDNRQLSQELQLLYNKGPLHAFVGAYYLDATAVTQFDVRLFTTIPGLTAFTSGKVKTNTWALFGDFTFDFTDRLSLSVGGRYTDDLRDSTILRQTLFGGGSPLFGGAGVVVATTSNFHGKRDFTKFTPRASLSFKPSPDQNLYVSYSEGFKGGGFDPRGLSTAAPDLNKNGVVDAQDIFNFLSFKPETVKSYEIGYKAALFDRRLHLSLAAFHADYIDVQVPGSIGAVVNGIPTFIGITTNAGKARMQGIEAEGNALLARDFAGSGSTFNFSWSLGYLDAKYLHFIDSRGIDVASERKIQNTPAWTASGTLNFGTPAAGGMLNAMTTISYRSSSQQFELATPGLDQSGFTLWDADLVWSSNSHRWSVGIHAKNLTNKKYIVSGYNFLAQNPDTGAFLFNAKGQPIPTLGKEGVLTAYYGNPRQVFVTVGLNF